MRRNLKINLIAKKMKLLDYINGIELAKMICEGYIKVVSHPIFPLKMYSYTQLCHYERVWNDTTMKCRGLIVDNEDNIISKPMKKFFNYEEYEDKNEIPSYSNVEIFEKLDGTLGILYWYMDIPYIATKGSFDSEQAKHATNILHTKYRNIWNELKRDCTYLFEIIYREDKHIISYNNIDDIFLIAILDNNNDYEYDISWYTIFNKPKKYLNIKDWKNIRNEVDGTNKEGFVIKFPNDFRLKMKYDEYLELHMTKYSFSKNKIIQLMVDNNVDEINNIMSMFEDEERVYIQSLIDEYSNEFNRIYTICKTEFRNDFETKKEAADYIKTCTYPSILFIMLTRNDKCVNDVIWKYVKRNLKRKNEE